MNLDKKNIKEAKIRDQRIRNRQIQKLVSSKGILQKQISHIETSIGGIPDESKLDDVSNDCEGHRMESIDQGKATVQGVASVP
jgi:hypothetical protein